MEAVRPEDRETLDILFSLCDSHDSGVRSSAASILRTIKPKDPESQAKLEQLVRHDDPNVVSDISACLVESGRDLHQVLSLNADVSEFSSAFLGRVAQHHDFLGQLESNPHLLSEVFAGPSSLSASHSVSPASYSESDINAATAAINEFIPKLASSNLMDRRVAAKALQKAALVVNNEADLARVKLALVKSLNYSVDKSAGSYRVPTEAQEDAMVALSEITKRHPLDEASVNELIRLLESPDSDIRILIAERAVTVLKVRSVPMVQALLTRVKSDSSPDVRTVALISLSQSETTDIEVLKAIKAALQDRQAKASIGHALDRNVEHWTGASSSGRADSVLAETESVRQSAAFALGVLGVKNPDAVRELGIVQALQAAATDDPHASVKDVAKMALKMIETGEAAPLPQ